MKRFIGFLLVFIALGCGDDVIVPPPREDPTLITPPTLPPADPTQPPEFVLEWGEFGSDPGQFYQPTEIEIGPDGTVYVLDNQNERVQKFSRDGEFILEWGNSGPRENYFTNLLDAIAIHEDRIYVSDILAARTLVFSDQGNLLQAWDFFAVHGGLDTDPAGNVYLSGFKVISRTFPMITEGPFVWKLTPEGGEIEKYDLGVRSIVLDEKGNLYGISHDFIGELPQASVTKFTGTGEFLARWDLRDESTSLFDDLAVDARGFLYVCNRSTSSLFKFAPDGEVLSEWSALDDRRGVIGWPAGIAVDSDRNVFVSDFEKHRIIKYGYLRN